MSGNISLFGFEGAALGFGVSFLNRRTCPYQTKT